MDLQEKKEEFGSVMNFQPCGALVLPSVSIVCLAHVLSCSHFNSTLSGACDDDWRSGF